nr:hypothetical protein Iba_chr12cCG7440 [Ipomoea batatas]GMD72126.1 hypothetical protein Iba_chr12fCG5580 [Ipomoea batatas]
MTLACRNGTESYQPPPLTRPPRVVSDSTGQLVRVDSPRRRRVKPIPTTRPGESPGLVRVKPKRGHKHTEKRINRKERDLQGSHQG